jgi:hypothetical protein
MVIWITKETGRTAGASRSPTQTKVAIPPAAAGLAEAAATTLLVTAAVQAKQLAASVSYHRWFTWIVGTRYAIRSRSYGGQLKTESS